MLQTGMLQSSPLCTDCETSTLMVASRSMPLPVVCMDDADLSASTQAAVNRKRRTLMLKVKVVAHHISMTHLKRHSVGLCVALFMVSRGSAGSWWVFADRSECCDFLGQTAWHLRRKQSYCVFRTHMTSWLFLELLFSWASHKKCLSTSLHKHFAFLHVLQKQSVWSKSDTYGFLNLLA